MKTILLYLMLCIFVMNCCYGQEVRLPIPARKNFNLDDLVRDLESIDVSTKIDSVIYTFITQGFYPKFLEELTPIDVDFKNSEGVSIKARYFVLKDYLSIGHDDDFIRVPMTPNMGQKLADTLGMYIITAKMSDDIYKQSVLKLDPIPLEAPRTLWYRFVEHNKLIEEQRRSKSGLIAGIKKDIVSTDKLTGNPEKVAIYGWHKLDGKIIQPVYIKHADHYVDYSHGIRLVYPYVYIDNKPIHFEQVIKDKFLRKIITYENSDEYYKYDYKYDYK